MCMSFLAVTKSSSQARINLEFIAPSIAFSYPCIGLEFNVVTIADTTSLLRSIRVATSFGPSKLNAQFLPVECRLSFLNNHIDVITGINIQTSIGIRDTLRNLPELSNSTINPTMGFVFRWQKDDGGFLFRFGMGAMYHIGDRRFYYSPILSFGFSLDD